MDWPPYICLLIIFVFFKCLPFRGFLAYSFETWLYHYFGHVFSRSSSIVYLTKSEIYAKLAALLSFSEKENLSEKERAQRTLVSWAKKYAVIFQYTHYFRGKTQQQQKQQQHTQCLRFSLCRWNPSKCQYLCAKHPLSVCPQERQVRTNS